MEKKLLQLLLSRSFWEANNSRLIDTMFEGDVASLYTTIQAAHETYGRDLTLDEVRALHAIHHPTLTTAAKANLAGLFDELATLEPPGEDVGAAVLTHMWKQETFRQIADIALRGLDGHVADLSQIAELVEQRADAFVPESTDGPVSDDLDVVLDQLAAAPQWKFNIETLAAKVPGIGPGTFTWYLARPETGKTAFYVSLACAPGGWCHQGANVHVLVNEEPGIRTKMRAFSAAAGMPAADIRLNRPQAGKLWQPCKGRFVVQDAPGLTLAGLDAYAREHRPDILIVDQLDDVAPSGTFDREDMRLKTLYFGARKVGVRHDCAMFTVSQASVEAEGKTVVLPHHAEGSKTGKFASADLILGLGMRKVDGATEEDFTRWITVGKNKISGWHGTVLAMLNPAISTYSV